MSWRWLIYLVDILAGLLLLYVIVKAIMSKPVPEPKEVAERKCKVVDAALAQMFYCLETSKIYPTIIKASRELWYYIPRDPASPRGKGDAGRYRGVKIAPLFLETGGPALLIADSVYGWCLCRTLPKDDFVGETDDF